MLEWNVIIEDINRKEITTYNVFNHERFTIDIKGILKSKPEKQEFIDSLNSLARYYFWSRCEWEIIITCWPENKNFNDKKFDVYEQLRLNWDKFCDYIWDNKCQCPSP